MILFLQIIFVCFAFFILYSYLIYPILLKICATLFGHNPTFDSTFIPSVTVLVPVYNEENVIEKKIKNIFSIDYPAEKISIYIGSDKSTDKTNNIVTCYPDKRIHLWIADKRGGKTEILNNLIPKIKSEIILLTDANTMHEANCLKKMVGYFSDPAIGIVAGRVIHMVKKGEEVAEEVYRNFEVWQKKHESSLHSSISAFGGFYALRKKYFRPIPYNAYSNDDVLIPMNVIRQKKRVLFEEEARSYEDVSGTIKMEFSRRVRIGAGNFQAFFWLLDFLNPFKGWPCFCFVSHKVIRWFSPIFLLGSGVSCVILYAMTTSSIYLYVLSFAGLFLFAGFAYVLIHLTIFRSIFYFLAMNLALLLGFFRFFSGIKSAAWSRTERK